jgi:phosphatidylserine decarboxylase
MAGWLGETSISWIKNPFTNWFVQQYGVNMSEAIVEDPTAYKSFNDFFTRALKDGARPIDSEDSSIVSPADGAISQLGDIKNGRIFQAKGQDFSLTELLGGDLDIAKPFMGGKFATVYLSPKDYHRVHMPMNGKLKSMIHVPGDLFSVNTTTAENVPRLFARNERTVCIFDTDIGPMAVVLVGAMIVASIETVWAGQTTPLKREIKTTHYPQNDKIELQKGEEMGRFKLGSTAVVLFAKDAMSWDEDYQAGSATVMGKKFGTIEQSE